MESNDIKIEIMSNYESRLNQEWVQILINLRMKYSKAFTRKRNSANDAWKSILDEMHELGAPESVTIGKIKKKWMNLVARYKYLKLMNINKITWPYFEQIDRAFSRNPNLFEIRKGFPRKKIDSDLNILYNSTDKEAFTTNLINLRGKYTHLFTGKKYAAQNGWTFIKNMLPNGKQYTIDQLSKCWQNLIQRYKSVLENEPNITKIHWVHFPKLHEILTQTVDDVRDNLDDDIDYQNFVNRPIIKQEIIESEKEDDSEIVDSTNNIVEEQNTENIKENEKITKDIGTNTETKQNNNPTVQDVLNYFKEKDKKVEEYLMNINRVLTSILTKM